MIISCVATGTLATAAHDAYRDAMASAEYWADAGDLELADSCVTTANRHELNAARLCNMLIEHMESTL